MRGRLILAVIGLVLLVVIIVGWIEVQNGFSARDNPTALEVFVARKVRMMAIPSDAKNQKTPYAATAEILTDARRHFADHCATCHGNDGSGNTTVGTNLYPKAPDMRLAATQNLRDGEIYYIIHNGVRLTGMPAWGEAQAKDEDRWKLVLFYSPPSQVDTRGRERHGAVQPGEPRRASGTRARGRIPGGRQFAHERKPTPSLRRMSMKRVVAISISLLYFATFAFAHGNEQHVMGTVTEVTDRSITVETEEHQRVTVSVVVETKFARGTSEATLKDVKVGIAWSFTRSSKGSSCKPIPFGLASRLRQWNTTGAAIDVTLFGPVTGTTDAGGVSPAERFGKEQMP